MRILGLKMMVVKSKGQQEGQSWDRRLFFKGSVLGWSKAGLDRIADFGRYDERPALAWIGVVVARIRALWFKYKV